MPDGEVPIRAWQQRSQPPSNSRVWRAGMQRSAETKQGSPDNVHSSFLPCLPRNCTMVSSGRLVRASTGDCYPWEGALHSVCLGVAGYLRQIVSAQPSATRWCPVSFPWIVSAVTCSPHELVALSHFQEISSVQFSLLTFSFFPFSSPTFPLFQPLSFLPKKTSSSSTSRGCRSFFFEVLITFFSTSQRLKHLVSAQHKIFLQERRANPQNKTATDPAEKTL